MPALLRKRRQSVSTPSSSSAASSTEHVSEPKHDYRNSQLLAPAHHRHYHSQSVKFVALPVTPRKKNKGESSASPVVKIIPLPFKFGKAVRKQLQRLDDAFSHKRSASTTAAGGGGAAGTGRGWALRSRRRSEVTNAEGSFLHLESSPPSRFAVDFPASFSSTSTTSCASSSIAAHPRQRRNSAPKDEKRLLLIVGHRPRTASCPDLSHLTYTPPLRMATTFSEGQPPKRRSIAPSVYVEPEVPDPFLVDDEGDALSDDESEHGHEPPRSLPARSVPPSMSPALSPAPSPHPLAKALPSPIPAPNVNKELPPPATDLGSDESDNETPELILHGVVVPTMFLPIPNVRPAFSSSPLTWWLSRSSMYYVTSCYDVY